MGLFDRLQAALRAFRGAGRELVAADQLGELAGRVAALEDIQTRRELEWAETKSALDRMLRRAAALKSLDAKQEEPTNGRLTRDQLRELMRQKGYLKGE